MCGDNYPIISNLKYLGLITALTSINAKEVIQKVKSILRSDPEFFQYILKIIPIDFVCETNVKIISQIINSNYREFINKNDSFKIDLKRRHNESIDRESFIEFIAKNIDNKVDLENPDKIIRIEILGNYSGLSFIKPDEIIRNKAML
ncbi:MAG: THUMP domain-containing protein [Promethearchaeota archaeon]